jgi:hypothetical protein
MITFGLDLNLIPGKVLPRLNVSQYDKGQTVSVSLWNGDVPYSIPTGYTAQVVGTKADKTGFMYNCTIAHGQPSFVITDQMTIFPGEVTLEVIILDTDKRIGTINFILDVERAALADDTQISESDMPIIQQIPEYANAAAASAEEAREWAEQARGVTSFNGREGAVTPANGDYTASQITSSAIAGQNNVESALTKINTDLTAITWRTSSAGFSYCVLPNGMKYAYKLQSITSGTEKSSSLHPNSYWGTVELNIGDIGFTNAVLAHADFKGSYRQHLEADAAVNWNRTLCILNGFFDQPNSSWECQVELIGF